MYKFVFILALVILGAFAFLWYQNDFKNQSFTLQLVMDFKSRTNDNISYFIGVCGNYFVRDFSQYVQRWNLSYYSNDSKGSAFLTGKIGFNLQITKRFYGSLSVVYIPKNERTCYKDAISVCCLARIARILNPRVDPLSSAQRIHRFLDFDLPHMLRIPFWIYTDLRIQLE